jgi:hypothetical protein
MVNASGQDFIEDFSIGDRFSPLVVRNPQFLSGKDSDKHPDHVKNDFFSKQVGLNHLSVTY